MLVEVEKVLFVCDIKSDFFPIVIQNNEKCINTVHENIYQLIKILKIGDSNGNKLNQNTFYLELLNKINNLKDISTLCNKVIRNY